MTLDNDGCFVFEQAQSLKTQRFWEESFVNIAVRRFYVRSPSSTIGQERTAASAPVAPFTCSTTFFLFDCHCLNSLTVCPDYLKWIIVIDACDGIGNICMAFCNASTLINSKIITPNTTGILTRCMCAGLIHKQTKEWPSRQMLFNVRKSGPHAVDHAIICELEIGEMR